MGTDIELSRPSARGSSFRTLQGSHARGTHRSPDQPLAPSRAPVSYLKAGLGSGLPETAVSRDSPSPFSESHTRSCVFGCRPHAVDPGRQGHTGNI